MEQYEFSVGLKDAEQHPTNEDSEDGNEVSRAKWEAERPERDAQQPIWLAKYAAEYATRFAAEYAAQIAAGKDDYHAKHAASDVADEVAKEAADKVAPLAGIAQQWTARSTAYQAAVTVADGETEAADAAAEVTRPAARTPEEVDADAAEDAALAKKYADLEVEDAKDAGAEDADESDAEPDKPRRWYKVGDDSRSLGIGSKNDLRAQGKQRHDEPYVAPAETTAEETIQLRSAACKALRKYLISPDPELFEDFDTDWINETLTELLREMFPDRKITITVSDEAK
jgi:hypothetical protein